MPVIESNLKIGDQVLPMQKASMESKGQETKNLNDKNNLQYDRTSYMKNEYDDMVVYESNASLRNPLNTLS